MTKPQSAGAKTGPIGHCGIGHFLGIWSLFIGHSSPSLTARREGNSDNSSFSRITLDMQKIGIYNEYGHSEKFELAAFGRTLPPGLGLTQSLDREVLTLLAPVDRRHDLTYWEGRP